MNITLKQAQQEDKLDEFIAEQEAKLIVGDENEMGKVLVVVLNNLN